VAEERETGNLWAIQVKFHEAKLSLQDISTFLTLSGRREFTHRLIVTASPLGPKAEEVLRAQDKPVAVLTLADILETPIDWDTFTWDRPENLPQQPEKQLRPYQAEAVEAVLKGFERSDRGKLIMPPGSGKTFVALKIAEKNGPVQAGTCYFWRRLLCWSSKPSVPGFRTRKCPCASLP